MKKVFITIIGVLVAGLTFAQPTMERMISDFSVVSAGEHINIYLSKGDEPSLFMESNGISPHDIITEKSGDKLKIYLRQAKLFDKDNWYRDQEVDVYLTYTELEGVIIKGDGELICKDPIIADRFFIRAYGNNLVQLGYLQADKLLTKAYGDNRIEILGGNANEQKLKLYGENYVNTMAMTGTKGKVSTFGTSDVSVAPTNRLHYNVFGESVINFKGNPALSNGLVFGEREVYRIEKRNN